MSGRIEETPVLTGPLKNGPKWLSRQTVDLLHTYLFRCDKTCFPEISQMLRDRGLRHGECSCQLLYRAVRFRQEGNDLSPRRMCDRFEHNAGRNHGGAIRLHKEMLMSIVVFG